MEIPVRVRGELLQAREKRPTDMQTVSYILQLVLIIVLYLIWWFSPFVIAVCIGLYVFGRFRKRTPPFQGAVRLRVVSACLSGVAMATVGFVLVALALRATDVIMGKGGHVNTISIVMWGFFMVISIVLAAIVGTGIGRSATPPRSDEDAVTAEDSEDHLWKN
jgi:hypothetical protein